jgi:hypothetical protein
VGQEGDVLHLAVTTPFSARLDELFAKPPAPGERGGRS